MESALLQVKIDELNKQVLHIKSTLYNVISNIRNSAEEGDYEEIIAECDRWQL